MQFDRFVGIPFREGGRDLSGCDCWGLLWLVFRDLRGVELPSYCDRYVTFADRKAIADLIAGESEPWQEIQAGQEQPFDAVKVRRAGLVAHVGLVVAPGLMLDVCAGTCSRIQRLGDAALRRRIAGFYRYRPA